MKEITNLSHLQEECSVQTSAKRKMRRNANYKLENAATFWRFWWLAPGSSFSLSEAM
jgi:hypothetical protein